MREVVRMVEKRIEWVMIWLGYWVVCLNIIILCIESFITTVNFLFLTKLGEKLPSAQLSICSLDIALGASENLEPLKPLYNLRYYQSF